MPFQKTYGQTVISPLMPRLCTFPFVGGGMTFFPPLASFLEIYITFTHGITVAALFTPLADHWRLSLILL